MKIINDLLGEYIYISKNIYPNVVIFYKDKNVVKSEEVSDVKKNIEIIAKSLNCLDSDYYKYVIENINLVEEVVFNKDGLIRFSCKLKE